MSLPAQTLAAIGIFAIVFFAQCRRDTGPPPQHEYVSNPPPPTQQFGFKKGNWWVYTCVSTPSYNPPYDKDSVVINRDTIINGSTFFKFQSYTPFPQNTLYPFTGMWVRDSSSYIISSKGEILYSTAGHQGNLAQDSTFINGLGWVYNFRKYELSGTYSVTCNATLYQSRLNIYEVTANPAMYPNFGTTNYHHYLSSSIGLIRYDCGLIIDSAHRFRHELLKYHVE